VIGQFPWDPFPPETPEPKGPDPIHRTAYQAAVTASDAYRSVRFALRREEGVLRVGNRFVADGRYRQVAFLALGNAGGSMALAALHVFGDRLTQGFLAGPEPVPEELPFRGVVVPPGLPGFSGSAEVVQAATEIADGLGPQDLLLLFVSPGALRAICVPPPGSTADEFGRLLGTAASAGATGREVALLARTLGDGGVGGRLAAAARAVDLATFVIDRGDGAGLVGGGPVDPTSAPERAEARRVLDRCGLTATVSPPLLDRLSPGADIPSTPPRVARPVLVATPSDGLRAAADAVFDRGWTSRLGFLEIREAPETAAETFMARAEELVAAEQLTAESRTKGVAVFAMTTLGLLEGVDEGPALAAFLNRATSLLRRREMSVGLYRTAGAIGSTAFPPAAVFGPSTDPKAKVRPNRGRGLPMRGGITDVGLVAVALCGVPNRPDASA
jgi:glycerate-2-kinase